MYPVQFDIQYQERYDRMQVVIRILILIVLSILAGAIGWIYGLAYLAVPVVAAILISQKGAKTYLEQRDDNIALWLRYLFAIYAYLGLLTDRLPNEDPRSTLRYEVQPDAEPSVGQVLLRIILAIPHAIVLGLLGIIAGILVIIAAIMVLIQERYPESIFNFLRGYARWYARMMSYMAGLVQAYPPFAFDTGPETTALPPAPPAPAPEEPQAP